MAVRSLGRLTLDLVAKVGGFEAGMDKAQRTAKSRLGSIRKEAAKVAKAVAAMGAAAGAAATAIVVSTVRSAEEIQRLANVANTTTQEFQRYAVGARTVGIENEKLADILKDTSDRVGDFLQTGGGPMADFFENIAPKIGVTAEQFRNLSGPQALELYVSSLEKANANQNEMTFYMEAIASDATLLLPLLRDNAEGFRILGDAAQDAGAILDEQAIQKANELRAANFLLEQSVAGVKNEIAEQLIPVLVSMAGNLTDVTDQESNAALIGEAFAGVLKGIAVVGIGTAGAIDLLARSLAGLAAIAGNALEDTRDETFLPNKIKAFVDSLIEDTTTLDIVNDDLESRMDRYNKILEGIISADGSNVDSRIKNIAEVLDNVLNRAPGSGTGINKTLEEQMADADKEAKKLYDTLQGQVEALEFQAATLGKSEKDATLLKLALEGATKAQLEVASAALDSIAAYERRNELQEEFNSLVDTLRTDQEVLTDQLTDQLAILDQMELSAQRRADLEARIVDGLFNVEAPDFAGVDASIGGPLGEMLRLNEAEDELTEWYDEQLANLEAFRESQAGLNDEWNQKELELRQEYLDELAQIEEARGLVRYTATQDLLSSLTGIAETFAGKQSGIYKALFVTEKAVAIARAAVAIQTGIAQAAAAPWPQNLAAMANVAAATASIIGNIQSISIGSAGAGSAVSAGGAGGGSRGSDTAAGTSITGAGIAIADEQGRVSSIRIINAFDPASVGDYLGSEAGGQVIVNVARMNSGAMKEALVEG